MKSGKRCPIDESKVRWNSSIQYSAFGRRWKAESESSSVKSSFEIRNKFKNIVESYICICRRGPIFYGLKKIKLKNVWGSHISFVILFSLTQFLLYLFFVFFFGHDLVLFVQFRFGSDSCASNTKGWGGTWPSQAPPQFSVVTVINWLDRACNAAQSSGNRR